MNTIIKRVLLFSSFSVLFFITGCEDEAADNDNTLSTDKFNISRVDVKSTGDASQSSPELIRFINSSEGVIVNSSQNTIDFFTISPSELSITLSLIHI